MELIVSGGILALTALIATGNVDIPVNPTIAPIATAILVIAALGSFSLYPAVGIALFVLTAVILFKRNVLSSISNKPVYGDISIPDQINAPAIPHSTTHVGPRNYDEFNDTDGHNPMLGAEGFEPAAAYGDESGSPVDGQYPIDEARASGSPDTRDYAYRPDPTTGSNEFTRFGPDMDEKLAAVTY